MSVEDKRALAALILSTTVGKWEGPMLSVDEAEYLVELIERDIRDDYGAGHR